MNWVELVQDEGRKVGVALTPEICDYLLWEHTGFPDFWHGDPESCCRAQIREVLQKGLFRWQTAYPPPPKEGPTAYDVIQGDYLGE